MKQSPLQAKGKFSLFKKIESAANHDFCPSLNRYVYWMKKPVGWVICGAILSAIIGFLVGPQGFILMWSCLVMLLIGCVWPWLVMKGIQCELNFESPHTEEDQPTTVALQITNKWPIPVFGLTVDGAFLQDVLSEEDQSVVSLQRLAGWSVSVFRWELTPQRRGILPTETPNITTGFPFGFCRCSEPIEIQNPMIVWPRCEDLKSLPSLNGFHFNISGKMSDRPGTEGDVIGARHYRRGDSLKNINWAQTARLNKLIVLERQSAAQQSIRIVIDLTPENHSGYGSQSTYEWAIRIAASICKQLHLNQSLIHVECFGLARETNSQSTNQKGLAEVLNFLSRLPDFDAVRDLDCKIKSRQSIEQKLPKNNEKIYWIHAREADVQPIQGKVDVTNIVVESLFGDDSVEGIENGLSDSVVASSSSVGSEFRKLWESGYASV